VKLINSISKCTAALFLLAAICCLPASLLARDVAGQDRETRLTTSGGVLFHVTTNPVENLKNLPVPGTDIELYLWDEVLSDGSKQSHYAISPDGIDLKGRVRATTYNVRLRNHDFDPLVQAVDVEPVLAARQHNTLHLVQFQTTPLEEFITSIESLGGTPHRFLTDHTFIMEMPQATSALVEQLPFVRWVGPYHPAYRLEDCLRDALAGNAPALEEQRYSIMVCERGQNQQDDLAKKIREMGGYVHFISTEGFRMEATLTHNQLLATVHANEAQFIDRWGGPGEVDMNNVREVGGANYLETMTGWTGQGVRGEIFDTEIRTTHQEWATFPIIHSNSTGSYSHGTSCYSINFAQGVQSSARGLCPDGQGIFFYYAESTQFGGSKSRYDICEELIDPNGPFRAVFQTASVGSDRTPNYTTVSAEVDDYLFLYQIISTQSQSNAGDQWSRPQAWAKNIVAVGGVYHYNTATRSDDHWGYGASIGPAQDGRIKPDLCYFYDYVYAAYGSGNTSYTEFSGTSAATPQTSGHFGLMFQMWHNGTWAGHGGGATVFESRPEMATAKALICNSAYRYDWNSGGSNADINRNVQGWGTANVQNLYDRADRTMVINETDLLTPLQTNTYNVTVPSGETQLNVTMVYTDLMGTVGANHHRINDLSLKVTSPQGTVYWGNNGLKIDNTSSSGGSSNTLDTVENVFIPNPQSGSWTVQVIGDEIVADSHPETPQLDADYGLVISGIELSGTSFTLDVSPDPLQGGQTGTFTATNGTPNAATYLAYSLSGPGSTYIGPLNVTLGLANPVRGAGPTTSNGSGNVTWNLPIPNVSGISVWFQACQNGNVSNVVATSIQ